MWLTDPLLGEFKHLPLQNCFAWTGAAVRKRCKTFERLFRSRVCSFDALKSGRLWYSGVEQAPLYVKYHAFGTVDHVMYIRRGIVWNF
jgi:hypothetical protein